MNKVIRYSLKYSLPLLLFVCLAGCSEEPEVTPAEYSRLLTGETSKTWRYQSFEFIFDEEDINPVNLTPPCLFSGSLVFSRQGRVLEINDDCSPLDRNENIGTFWAVNNANATLTIGGLEPYTIKQLTANTLVFGFKTPVTFNSINTQTGFAQFTFKVQAQ